MHGGPPQPQFAYRKGSRPLLELEAWAPAGFPDVVFAAVGGLDGPSLTDFSGLSVFSFPVAALWRASSSTSVSVVEVLDSVVSEEETDVLSESAGMVGRVS